MKTNDIQTALYNAHGRKATFNGHTYQLSAEFRDVIYPYKRTEFHCTALDLTPQDENERKFCIWDLWRSESDDAAQLMLKFAKMGGFEAN